jgi:hypothetical protein
MNVPSNSGTAVTWHILVSFLVLNLTQTHRGKKINCGRKSKEDSTRNVEEKNWIFKCILSTIP